MCTSPAKLNNHQIIDPARTLGNQLLLVFDRHNLHIRGLLIVLQGHPYPSPGGEGTGGGCDADPNLAIPKTEETLVLGLLAGIGGHAAIEDIVIANSKHKVQGGHFSCMLPLSLTNNHDSF